MPAGRPSVMTEEVISKLEEAYSHGCTDSEACLYAGISLAPFYKWQEKNPKFKERKQQLKDQPKLHARLNLSKDIQNARDIESSKWFLERKAKDEVSKGQQLVDSDGEPITSIKIELAGIGQGTKDTDS